MSNCFGISFRGHRRTSIGECFGNSFRGHRRTSIGEVSLLLRSHVACVSKTQSKKQKQTHECWQRKSQDRYGRRENPKVRTRVRVRNLVQMVLKTRYRSHVQKLRNLHRRTTLTILTGTVLGLMMAGVSMDVMVTGVRLDGMKVGHEPVRIPQAHFHLEVFDLGAMNSPKRFEWVKMILDTGVAW